MYDFFDKGLGYIQFTIQKFYRINGGSTQNKGVTPDILFPTAIDPEETGESVEANALPWDSGEMASISYSVTMVWSNSLRSTCSKDLEFGFIAEDISNIKKKMNLFLNEKVRKDESEQADKVV